MGYIREYPPGIKPPPRNVKKSFTEHLREMNEGLSPRLTFKCIFVLFLALQGSDPDWYTALINVLDGEQTRALQDVFVLAEQRKNALGESRGPF